MTDPRKEYIVSCALGSLGALGSLASRRWEKPSHELEMQLRDAHELNAFLETASLSVLQVSGASRKGGRRELCLSLSVSMASDADIGVVFTKRSTETITDSNVEEIVMMQTLHGAPLHSLQLMIQQLYAPLLLQDPHRSSTLDPKTQSTLEALEKAVSSAVQRGVSADDISGKCHPSAGPRCHRGIWAAVWRPLTGTRVPGSDSAALRRVAPPSSTPLLRTLACRAPPVSAQPLCRPVPRRQSSTHEACVLPRRHHVAARRVRALAPELDRHVRSQALLRGPAARRGDLERVPARVRAASDSRPVTGGGSRRADRAGVARPRRHSPQPDCGARVCPHDPATLPHTSAGGCTSPLRLNPRIALASAPFPSLPFFPAASPPLLAPLSPARPCVTPQLQDVLRDVFDLGYPEARMQHLILLLGSALDGYVKRNLSRCALWRDAYRKVSRLLREAAELVDALVGGTGRLITTFWAGKWRGAPFRDETLARLGARLQEVLSLRAVQHQLSSILSEKQVAEMRVGEVFQPFEGIDALHHSTFAQLAWEAAVKRFDSLMQPIERDVAHKLQERLTASGLRGHALLREFLRSKELMMQPIIFNELAPAREALLGQLLQQLDIMRDEFESRSGQYGAGMTEGRQATGKNLPEVVHQIVLARQLEIKAAEMLAAADTLLHDLQGMPRFQSKAQELHQYLNDHAQKHFAEWVDEVESQMREPGSGLCLQLKGQLMEVNKDDLTLKVNYSDRLVRFLREMRQLSALGFKMPQSLQLNADVASRFYRHGIVLKQVANFYNTIDTQIVRSQKPLLLDHAVRFEQLATNPQADKVSGTNGSREITWSDPSQLETYIKQLHEAAERLTQENRRLRQHHTSLGEQVAMLMDVSLLRQQVKWKERVEALRATVDALQPHYSGMKGWRIHWDMQLFKALEHQYQMGLEGLHLDLPHIKCELEFKARRLQFRPSIEELRSDFYREIRKFISIPTGFKGLGYFEDGGSGKHKVLKVFRDMPDRNVSSLLVVYERAAELFAKLEAVADRYRPWMLLGEHGDAVDDLIEERLTEASHFEANFKVLKQKRKEAEKLPNSEKVDCIAVNLLPFKTALEDQYQRLSDALLLGIRRSALGHQKAIEGFIDGSMQTLSKRPQSVDEVGDAKSEWNAIATAKEATKERFLKLEQLNKLLRSVGQREGLETAALHGQWEDLELTLDAFNDRIEDQMQHLRGQMDTRIGDVQLQVQKFSARWFELKPKKLDTSKPEEMMALIGRIKEWQSEFHEVVDSGDKLTRDCEHFDIPPPQFAGLQDVKADLESYVASCALFEEYMTELEKLSSEDWISFRQRTYVFDDFVVAWKEKSQACPRGAIADHLRTELNNYQDLGPLLKNVRGDAFQPEHWATLFRKLEIEKVSLDKLCLSHFLGCTAKLLEHREEIKELNARATGEVALREAVQEVTVWSQEATFSLTSYTNNHRTTPLIKDWKDMTTQVSDLQALLGSLKDSHFFGAFADQVNQYETKLALLDQVLAQLNPIQRKWVYLEPIFARGAMPNEQPRFQRVDDEFTSIMQSVGDDPRVFSLLRISNLAENLKAIFDQLERCQKALSDFLEQKRQSFPRFYFIGDDDLLEILGQSKNPAVIQTHLKKLFAGIFKVQFSEGNKDIIAMCSIDQEIVPLIKPVAVTEQVEGWLQQLSITMKETLVDAVSKTVSGGSLDIEKTASQVLCVSEMVSFTRQAESAIQRGRAALEGLKKELLSKLNDFTSTETDVPLIDIKLKSLVMDLIHNISVVDQLIDAQASSLSDWKWRSQLRYYQNPENGRVFMMMVDAKFDYTYEYQGNAPKLVHTPLTDKCYLTLTQAMFMGYGGNPYGPAGTGKTESVKALGNAFGRQVLVFNCDEGIDSKSMGRIFVGLIKCGAWGCFDEFNRLLPDQLSEISQQIQIIQHAIKSRNPTVELLGGMHEVEFNAGIFVTLNPAGKGYLGRSQLPDNLKALFRAVAMSKPDNELISEVQMTSEGFVHAKALATKLVAVFQLSQQLLTPQQHYDWGLRALKTVLRVGGQLIQAEKKKLGKGEKVSREVEEQLLIKALRINTLSKLTYSDTAAFNALISDVFPGAAVADVSYEELEAAIKVVLHEEKLEELSLQMSKIIQFYEATQNRMGVVVVGPSGCGKTTMWRVLKLALAKLGRAIPSYVMNPKSMPRHQLLGIMDNDTREWFDGVLTAASRKVVQELPDVKSWIICDGDIDPEWIESLNSVLDDNRLLTMPNGERIQFGPNVNFIFETHSLKFASPATVSRMGMIFLDQESSDINCIVNCWVRRQPEEKQMKLSSWIDDCFFKALDWVVKDSSAVVETTHAGVVNGALSHLVGVSTKAEFACAAVRGFGSNLPLDRRNELARLIYQWTNEVPADHRQPLSGFYDTAAGQQRMYALDTSVPIDAKALGAGDAVLVKTPMVQSNEHLLSPWMSRLEPLILVGPEGSGKNMLLNYMFSTLKSTQVAVVNCSAQTLSTHVINKLAQVCQRSTTQSGQVFRPNGAQRLVLYLKDINLPKPDKYETAELIAFLQQLVCYQGFYDKNLDFVGLQGIQIVASMNPSTTVGRFPLSTRFTANVRLGYVHYPDKESLGSIYSSILQSVLEFKCPGSPTWGGPNPARKLAACMVDVYENVKKKFSVDDQRHYMFNPRDLTQWAVGMLRYELADTGPGLLNTWAFEGARLLRDRLVNSRDCTRFDTILTGALRSHFDFAVDDTETTYTALLLPESDRVGNCPDKTITLQKAPLADVVTVIKKGIIMFEREIKELNLVLFPDALQAIMRIERVLTKPGSNLLMVGASGVGRRSLLSLACYLHGIEMVSPSTVRDYSLKSFRSEMKVFLPRAGVHGTPLCLLLEDHQLRDDAIIECVNSLLASGEIPGLFEPQELEPLLGPLKEEMGATGFKHRTLFDFFIARVQSFLHVALIMNPSSPGFVMRCESNPALYTRCSMLWQAGWSKGAMEQLPPEVVFNDIDEEQLAPPMRGPLISSMLAIHLMHETRGDGTPRKFTCFIRMWKQVFLSERSKKSERIEQLRGGLNKLTEAADEVDKLQKLATQQRAELTIKQQEADTAMEQIQKSMERAVERRNEVEQLTTKLNTEEAEMTVRKAQVEKELEEVQPLIEQAQKAVGGIKSDNLNEIRSLKMPPEPIRDVLEGVLRLMGNFDTSWISMKRFLGNRSVKDEILNFDSTRITPEIRAGVMELLKTKGASFEHATIHRVSVAASPLAAWVKANLEYSAVLIKIAPLTKANAELQADLVSSKDRLDKCQTAMAVLDEKVKELKDNFAHKTAEAERLKQSLQKAEDVLGAALELLEKLSGERTRWDAMHRELSAESVALAANSLLSASFITYLADEQEAVRLSYMKQAVEQLRASKLMTKESFDTLQFLSSEGELLRWKSQGLPSDKLSQENGIVLMRSALPPLIIDPSNAAVEWVKNSLRDANVSVELVSSHEARFANALELAVRFGKTLVVQEVDKIEPILVPVIRKDLVRQGPRLAVQIGEKMIDYNETFRMMLATRNPTPDIPADVASLVTIVNFSVTLSGLEGRLLGLTIQHEQPELEHTKTTLLKAEEDLKIQLEHMEQKLLVDLSASEGNILENKPLITSLNELKTKSQAIKTKLEQSSKLQESLDTQRNVYQPVAAIGSRLFFTLLDLQKINPMYRFALPMFVDLYTKALNAKELGHANPQERTRALGPLLERLVFGSVSRSLLKADRLTYGMHLVHMLHPEHFGEGEWEVFTGSMILSGGTATGGQLPPWAAQENQAAFQMLAMALPALLQKLDVGHREWERWAKAERAEAEFPNHVPDSITPFQRILFIQALRPERLQPACTDFISRVLKVDSLSPMSSALPHIHEDSTAAQPILMITTAGAAPDQELEDLAARVMPGKYHALPMGGQTTGTALSLVRDAAKRGHWLCLKNLHLVVHWVPQLEKDISSLEPHPDFRLWLTTEQHAAFPPIILQQSLKITFEAPPGVHKNLLRTYESLILPEFMEKGTPQRAQLLMVIAWFHAVLQERRSYIPQGWTKFYEFSPADLRSAVDICDSSAGLSKGQPDWVTMHGLLSLAVYGGRVDNVQDERLLHCFLHHYFSRSMLSSLKLAPGVSIPTSNRHADYMRVIESIPWSDSPTVFGLPANADVAVQKRAASAVQSSLRTLGIDKTGSSAVFDREKWAQALSPILALWQKLVTTCEKVRGAKPRVDPSAAPVDGFVALELVKAQALLKCVDASLGAIGRVVRGTELLNATTKKEGNCLIEGVLPPRWEKEWEGSEAPVKWMKQVVVRIAAISGWHEASASGSLLTKPLNLHELLNPGFFLTALRQQTARSNKVPMDMLELSCALSASELGRASLAVTISGLMVQGATCAVGAGLNPLNNDAPTLSSMPDIHLAWVPNGTRPPYESSRSALVPLYVDRERTTLLCELRLPCSGSEAQWLQAGVACFLAG